MEVLVATVLLALVVITVNLSCKQYFDMQGKMRHMENIYLSALSLKDRIESDHEEGDRAETGQINGLNYYFTVTEVDEKYNYVQGANPLKSSIHGDFRLRLLRVELQLAGRSYGFLTTLSDSPLAPLQGGP